MSACLIPIHRWLAALLLLCATLACTKNDTPEPPTHETEVYGRIVLRGTNHKATNFPCTIRAYHTYGTDVLWVNKTVKVAETVTDTNGYFSVKFTAANLDKFGYFIRLETPLANHYNPTDMQHRIQPGQKQELNLNYTPYAWLKLRTKNVNPQVGDKLTVYLFGGEEYIIWGPVEAELTILRPGNVTNEIPTYLTRNGLGSILSFNIFLPAFDTTDYYLEY
jgi:hypothetical protein